MLELKGNLLLDDLVQRTLRSSHHDGAGGLCPLGNSWRKHRSLAVAKNEHPLRVGLRQRACKLECRNRIGDGLAFDRHPLEIKLALEGKGPLVVAQRGDAGRCQPLCQVAEGFVLATSFTAAL